MRKILVICVIMFGVLVSATVAQEPVTVTDDDVNAIAERLYCPVCENIPLDTCGTAACADWRAEIRLMLENGMGSQEIIDDFVQRFGDRVVGTPKAPVLRAISLITPWLLIFLVVIWAAWAIILRPLGKQKVSAEKLAENNPYQDLLEEDIQG